MKHHFLKTISVLLLLFLFSSSLVSSQNIKGNGVVMTKEREVLPFTGIIASGSFELFLEKGDEQKVIIETDENIHNLFISNVRNENLDIQIVGEVKRAKALKVYVTFVNLKHLITIGAVDVRSETLLEAENVEVFASGVSSVKLNIKATNLNLEITDGAYVFLQGTAEELDIRVTDEAEVNAFNLKANNCYTKISGYSDAKINVSGELRLRVTGAGNLYYKGTPKITDRIFSGTGFIIRRKNE